tara:strand:- start:797 stop:967 length:171 start_codon:yes stop_codon:yes gene_type:complete
VVWDNGKIKKVSHVAETIVSLDLSYLAKETIAVHVVLERTKTKMVLLYAEPIAATA